MSEFTKTLDRIERVQNRCKEENIIGIDDFAIKNNSVDDELDEIENCLDIVNNIEKELCL